MTRGTNCLDKRREQLQQELNTVYKKITELRIDLAKSDLSKDDFKDWERDEISATKYEELKRLEARREEIENEIHQHH